MRGIKRIVRLVVILALLSIVGFSAYNLFFLKPKVENLKELEKLPKKKEISLIVTPRAYVDRVSVFAIQGGKEVLIFEGKLPKTINEVRFLVEPEKLGLQDGNAKVIVELRRLFLFKESFEISTIIDTEPPRIRIIYAPYTVLQGGSGGIRVRTSEPVDLYVEVGERRFRSYQVGDKTYISLFGVPVSVSTRDVIKIVAIDRVGNETVIPLGTGIKKNNFRKIRMELKGKEKAIRLKLETILGGVNENLDFITLFKKVNEDLRKENIRMLEEIGKRSSPERFWRGDFLQMSNSKVISRFGELREYTYEEKIVSKSWHLGYDLASVRNAKVIAANSGTVVFAGNLGIYGNTVIIDHGYGLMSLYAHLADFRVKEGDFVKKGQIIGVTDTTGLAFGDHLHFGILIGGLEVTPLEWWDAKWIKTRIEPIFSE